MRDEPFGMPAAAASGSGGGARGSPAATTGGHPGDVARTAAGAGDAAAGPASAGPAAAARAAAGPAAVGPAAAARAAAGRASGPRGDGVADAYAWEADLYDVTTAEVSEHDVPFYTALAADAAGPILELACGTARVLAPCAAAAAGRGVGVDVSPAMLERARRRLAASNLADRVELHLGDMRTVRLGRRFPLVTVPFRSMFHLPDDDDWLAALGSVRAHLAPGGRFAGDVFVPNPELLAARQDHHGFAGEVRLPDTGQRVALWEHSSFDPVAQVARRRRVTEVLDDDGLVLERRHRLLEVHFRYPREVLRLLATAGFTVEQVFGGFDGRPLDEGAEDLIWIARVD
jgi:SAM-dependent methyltransferase